MTIFELEENFKTEEGMQLVVEEYSEVIAMVDKYSDLAFNHKLDNPGVVDQALDVLQGCFGKLNPVLGFAEEAKDFQEDNHYHTVKQETVANGDKFVDAVAKREASLVVAPFRRTRNLFTKYVGICDKAITNLQSRAKKIDNQKNLNKSGVE